MKQVTTRGPTQSCRALQSRTTQLRSGLLLELRSIALGFCQPAFLALPTWRIHASPLRPLVCLRTLITAGGKHCPLHSHTQHPQERKPELCTRNTRFTNPWIKCKKWVYDFTLSTVHHVSGWEGNQIRNWELSYCCFIAMRVLISSYRKQEGDGCGGIIF
jgi:hypothetical protein